VRSCALLVREQREAQAGRSRADRLGGPHLRIRRPCPARVLLVDDVTTTGASLARAGEALRSGGARSVHGGVIAVVD
jgi:predicted amidophosphoribosyltransferase